LKRFELSWFGLVGLDWLVQRQIEVGKLDTRVYCLLFNVRTNEMNTYLSVVKLQITTTSTTTTKVLVQATDSYKAKLQLEAMYGRGNVVSSPQLVR